MTSLSMLTINGDGHSVMGRFHRPGDERRSLVVVEPCRWLEWLSVKAERAKEMLLPMDENEFTAAPANAEPQQLTL